MSFDSIVEKAREAQAATAAAPAGKRVSYGIVINVGDTKLNEWGLSETEAKLVHKLLQLNGDKPLPPTKSGIVYSRREPSSNASELAALEAQLLAAAK